ncbi:DNA (cytosine-5)-methyltransferase 1-like [Ladona fulva]|uniref:DNA (cytosine-5)-methyltransferase n=1 Tax=Ladona fulva TaxID=123851 RepID=A0A8K0P0S2_LADFU|nr:DNA (cytosine-5)-methyltransferase 1-like [Ladona fulva]
MEPSENYATFMDAVKEKIFLSKVVIEFLCGERGDGGHAYEDLLRTIQATIPPADFPSLTEEGLLEHAQFVCEQVRSFDEADSTDLDRLLMMPCMQTLIKLGGVRFGKRQKVLSCVSKDLHKKVQLTKATTTPLVREIFEMFFRDKIKLEHHEKIQGQKNRPCGICETCQKPDCGTCMPCRDMLKFGGNGLSKQTCNIRKRCPEVKILVPDSSEDVCEEDNTQIIAAAETTKSMVVQNFKNKKKTYDSNSKSTAKQVERLTANDKRISGPSKCSICFQVLHNNKNLKFYEGHPKGAVKEKTVLQKPCISSLLGDSSDDDEKPQVKITGFTYRLSITKFIVNDGGRMIGFFQADGVIVVIDRDICWSTGGIPARDLGSIKGWWISGFDGGESVLIGFSTELGEYILMEPSEEYAPYMAALKEKIFLSKVVIEFLCGERGDGGHTYEDLLRTIQMATPPADVPPLTEERLLIHAQFVCEQVRSFDEADVTDFEPLLNTSCMQSLIKFGCVTFTERLLKRKIMEVGDLENEDSESEDEESSSPIKKLRTHVSGSKRTVTWVGDNIFKCGIKTYYNRGSETVLGETADPTEVFCTDECEDVPLKVIVKKVKVFHYKHPEDWANLGGIADGSEIQKHFVSEGKCKDGEEILWFQKRCTARSRTIFTSQPDPCTTTNLILVQSEEKNGWVNCSPTALMRLLLVFVHPVKDFYNAKFKRLPEWLGYCKALMALMRSVYVSCDVVYYLKEEFRRGTFVFIDPAKVPWKIHSLDEDMETKDTPKEVDEDLYPEHYRKYLSCGVRQYKNIKRKSKKPIPFIIGLITDVVTKQCLFLEDSKFETETDIWLDVNVFYRPEDTRIGVEETYRKDLNLLYWTRDSRRIQFKSVARKCHVVYGGNVEGFENPDNLQHWSSLGPNRFYFLQAYDPEANIFYDPPAEAKSIGKVLKIYKVALLKDHFIENDNGQGMEEEREDEHKVPKMEEWPTISRPLRALDVFAGCGVTLLYSFYSIAIMEFGKPENGNLSLSNGLHQSGVATTEWAIEKNEADANTFRLNNPKCSVFIEDCNDFLHNVISGKTMNERGQRLPRKGEVELLCGGPPCQGFSQLNRYKTGEYSLYRNSLIASFLSFCDYFRPRFFILENVRNLVSYDRNMVLKLTLRCLLRMGYQCCFAVLQAGNYEIPQSRKRVIILAAAPGEILPRYPLPVNVFISTGCYLSVKVDDEIYVGDIQQQRSAPFRVITVRDAISDLPKIQNGSDLETMSYGGKPLSHFQRQVRGSQKELKNHICRLMTPISECRIAHIPPGCDWRDLPNIVVRLSDGTYTKKLVYNHDDIRVGRSGNGALRGVCVCATGKKKCGPLDRQSRTLIPWGFPHTGNRQAHWPSAYGRLKWSWYFPTIITNPEPLGKQGRVLHPEQNRVVSVRECARSQGFMDSYQFYGNITDKYRQAAEGLNLGLWNKFTKLAMQSLLLWGKQLGLKFENL